MKDILNELGEVSAAQWHQLGIQLGVPVPRLTAIEKDHLHDVQRCMSEVIIWWHQNTPECSWAKLAEALELTSGYAVLAKKLRKKTFQG